MNNLFPGFAFKSETRRLFNKCDIFMNVLKMEEVSNYSTFTLCSCKFAKPVIKQGLLCVYSNGSSPEDDDFVERALNNFVWI